ncbi:MAG: cupin domain-containing protein, partial [Aeromicrobium sp.]
MHPQLWGIDPGPIVLPDQGRLLDLGTFQAVVLADGGDTSGDLTVLQTQNEPPGFGPPLHRHRDAAEVFFVLEGEYLMLLDGEQQRCPPGTFVSVPGYVSHTFKVSSAGPGKKLNLFTPAARVGFFEDLAASEASGTATPAVLDEIATRNRMEVLGAVP